jgi:hypothetical protein
VSLTSFGRDMYVRHTNTDGRSYVHLHRVWSGSRFILARETEAANLNAEALRKEKPALAKAEQITEDQFHNERKA